jgi:hypothetical protein
LFNLITKKTCGKVIAAKKEKKKDWFPKLVPEMKKYNDNPH